MPREDLPFCECRWLERAANDPDCPIEFDSRLCEYKLTTKGKGYMAIYYCPFCASRAPASLRRRTFTTISPEETIRLHLLTKDLKTEDDVRALFGEPSSVFEPGAVFTSAEKDGEPRETHACRTIRYNDQSDTAVININVGRYGKVTISFIEKHIQQD
jgi:hypothetical protein